MSGTGTVTATPNTTAITSTTVRGRVATVLAVLLALGIGYVGVNYLLAPESTASGFGLPEWPHGGAAAFLDAKGIRDLASGIAVLVLLGTGHRRALGRLLLVDALIPLGDAITVLTHHGSAVAAFGIHGATAVTVAATGALLLTERRSTSS
ncbi:DUF4267 domain-containing protein [Kitasatospora sp. NPDC004723]|uniref:DUF4267 domain-containing protein n=1 Tax=Kitasatospora sp. NPDC004723 TaxID=3154288 RepID=UPI0033BA6252